jgi:hypothetical protein
MMRNLIVLGCAGLLAVGLSLAGYAGAPVDSDNDGVPDQHDNCASACNGPLCPASQCSNAPFQCCMSQEDGDLDGYGNNCDFDTDGDGATSINDAIDFFAESALVGTDPAYDPDCDGATSINDALGAFAASNAVATPGPSGLSCASKCATPEKGCTAMGAPCP